MAINRKVSRAPVRKRGHKIHKTPLYRAKIAARARRRVKQQARVQAQAQANQAAALKPVATKKRRSRRNNALVTSLALKTVAACGVMLGLVIALVVFKDAVFASLLPAW